MSGDGVHCTLGHAARGRDRGTARAARLAEPRAPPGALLRRPPRDGRAARGQRVRVRTHVRHRRRPRALRRHARPRHPHRGRARQAAERDHRGHRSRPGGGHRRDRRAGAARDRLRRGAAGDAQLPLVHPAPLRIGHPLGVGHRHGRRGRHRVLSLGHHPGVQRPGSRDGDPAHRDHGHVRGRRLRPHPAGCHLRRELMRVLGFWAIGLLALLIGASSSLAADPSWPQEITFALLSTENAAEITRRWSPIIAQLEKDLGVKVKAQTATDYRGTIEALKFNKAQVGHLGPKSYVEASTNNYANIEPVAQLQLANGSLGYRSCLIVHADSDIFSPEDLAGRTFAFNDPNSTSGYLVPSAFFMMELNVDPKTHFSKVMFSGSHEASILAVANKKVEVASTNLPDLQQLTRESKVPRGALRVIWVSRLIPNDPIVVRKDLPASLRGAIQESLLTMKARSPETFKEVGAWLGGFVSADDGKYQVIRELNETAKRLAAKK